MIRNGLSDSENMIQEMSTNETAIEKPCNLVYIVKNILECNRHSQEIKGLKILTPDQILSRLSITSAQVRGGNKT